MTENNFSFVSYNSEHSDIVKNGIQSINEVLNGADTAEKRSLLLCLDKFLDPYYGYNLSYFDDLILLLQKHLFKKDEKEVKKDILELLTCYSKGSLDYLADKIEEIDPDLLAGSLYALGNTNNMRYVPIFINFENHEKSAIRDIVKEALNGLSKLNKDSNI